MIVEEIVYLQTVSNKYLCFLTIKNKDAKSLKVVPTREALKNIDFSNGVVCTI